MITFHPELQQLVYSPLAEQSELRLRQTFAAAALKLRPGEEAALGPGRGNMSEVSANFSMPAAGALFGLRLHISTEGADRPPYHRPVLICWPKVSIDGLMIRYPMAVQYSDPTELRVWIGRAVGAGATQLEAFVNATENTGSGAPYSVGVGIRDPSPASGFVATNTLQLLPRDTALEIRCFIDVTFVECFYQGGRVALTVPLAAVADQSYCHFKGPHPPRFRGISAFAERQVMRLTSVGVWDVGTIWLPP